MCALALDCPGYGFEQHKATPSPTTSRRWTGSARAPITAASSPPVVAARQSISGVAEPDLFVVDTENGHHAASEAA